MLYKLSLLWGTNRKKLRSKKEGNAVELKHCQGLYTVPLISGKVLLIFSVQHNKCVLYHFTFIL